MKHLKLLSLSLVAAMAVGTVGLLAPAELQTPSASAVDDTNDDWLHVEGNKVCDAYGKEVWLTGANWFGFNCGESFPHGLWSADLSDLLLACADHGINLLRIPVCTELLYTWMKGNPASASGINAKDTPDYSFNPELVDPATGTTGDSLFVFRQLLHYCKEVGIKVMVDVHSPHSNNSGHNYELWYGMEYAGLTTDTAGKTSTTKDWIDTWCWLAKEFKNDDTLIAFDLKNEPHGKRGYKGDEGKIKYAKWDDSTDENNWKYAAETCANAILDINPNLLIMVEGIEVFPNEENGITWADPDVFQTSGIYYGAWWGGNLRGARNYDLKLGANQDQLVYSPHDYGPAVYDQAWFYDGFNVQTLLDDYWYDTWAYLYEEGKYPLLIGEWGGFMDGGRNQHWLDCMSEYIQKNHIHHTFWCLNPNSGDTGGLLDTQFKNWDEEKYALFEETLWQTSSGTYIGLDHQRVLGTSGTNVAKFYNENVVTLVTTASTDSTTTTTSTSSSTSETRLYGDINCDKAIDIGDAIVYNRFISEDVSQAVTQEGLLNGDVDGNGDITSNDTMLVMKFIAKIIPYSELCPK